MMYDWDEAKRRGNLAQHGIDFAIASEFEWDTALTAVDHRQDYGELRYVSVGFIGPRLYILATPIESSACGRPIGERSDAMSTKSDLADRRARALASLDAVTSEEEDAISRGIAADPDNPELAEADFARMRPAEDLAPEIVKDYRAGSGSASAPRQQRILLRLDHEVVERFRATGEDWQQRINDALRHHLGL